jgi:hypothetical protein
LRSSADPKNGIQLKWWNSWLKLTFSLTSGIPGAGVFTLADISGGAGDWANQDSSAMHSSGSMKIC